VLVLSVPGDTPLQLQGGDVIRLVDGRPPETPLHLMRILQSYRPGENFRFEIMRDKKTMTVVGRMPQ
jgi:S1-C subfamily serine protease